MPRQMQRYITGLLEQLLGPAEHEKRFDWARGDSRTGGRGVPLPFDAVWENRHLIVEIDEQQHRSPAAYFDKPDVMTVSGVHRGEQRRLYDERKTRLAEEQGYLVIRVSVPLAAVDASRASRAMDLVAFRALLARAGVEPLT